MSITKFTTWNTFFLSVFWYVELRVWLRWWCSHTFRTRKSMTWLNFDILWIMNLHFVFWPLNLRAYIEHLVPFHSVVLSTSYRVRIAPSIESRSCQDQKFSLNTTCTLLPVRQQHCKTPTHHNTASLVSTQFARVQFVASENFLKIQLKWSQTRNHQVPCSQRRRNFSFKTSIAMFRLAEMSYSTVQLSSSVHARFVSSISLIDCPHHQLESSDSLDLAPAAWDWSTLSCFSGLYWRIHQMELLSSVAFFAVLTALSTYLLSMAYRNTKFYLKHKIAVKREDAITREMTQLLADDKMSRKEKDERILWKKNEVSDFEATVFSIFYNNAIFIAGTVFCSFWLFRAISPTFNYVITIGKLADRLFDFHPTHQPFHYTFQVECRDSWRSYRHRNHSKSATFIVEINLCHLFAIFHT